MNTRYIHCWTLCLTLAATASVSAGERALRPDALLDLATQDGADAATAAWRYADVAIVNVAHRAVGSDLKATGEPNRTHDISPDARAAGFDDSGWTAVAPEALVARRSNGRLSLGWYRTPITIPEEVAGYRTRGSTVVFEIIVDDYAEIWIDGMLTTVPGERGGQVPAGWNAPNRVVLTHDADPGRTYQLAILGINGPISARPETYIWVRSATLQFYAPGRHGGVWEVPYTLQVQDSAVHTIVPADTTLELLATGFGFGEGPVWSSDGYLLFSDPNENAIYRYVPEGEVAIFRPNSGYTGADIGRYRQPGSNGLAFDAAGRLTVCEHGNRRVTRIEHNGLVTVLADSYEGRRLNSPNDLVYRSDGALFFTDPPFGLPDVYEDPAKELASSPVFCLIGEKLKIVSEDLKGPNGLAFSPDEKYLYVANWDPQHKVVMRYRVTKDGDLRQGTVFFDMTGAPGDEALDGVKVDARGNLFVSGPGGVWILSPAGVHLGTLVCPELPANLAWGDDGRTLYLTARSGLYRMRLPHPGARTPFGDS